MSCEVTFVLMKGTFSKTQYFMFEQISNNFFETNNFFSFLYNIWHGIFSCNILWKNSKFIIWLVFILMLRGYRSVFTCFMRIIGVYSRVFHEGYRSVFMSVIGKSSRVFHEGYRDCCVHECFTRVIGVCSRVFYEGYWECFTSV